MIIESIVVLGILGLGFGIFLAYFSKKFEVKQDPRVEEVLKVLPNANCGACGYAGCAAYAEAVVLSPNVPPDMCIPGQKAVALQVAKIVGKEVSAAKAKPIPRLKCTGGSSDKFSYDGIKSCKAASLVSKGPKSCVYGCIGLGDCKEACLFGAVKMENGIPQFNPEKCIACRACAEACPKGLIDMVPGDKQIHVLCNSKDIAKDALKACKDGCIKCKLCEKNCPVQAITVTSGIAQIDYAKCTMCGKCITVCPKKIIVDERK